MTEEKKPESKVRKMYPKKLIPPPEVLRHMINKERKRLPKNRALRFFHIFFNEGF